MRPFTLLVPVLSFPLVFFACLIGQEEQTRPRVLIRVVDSNAAPFHPERVIWHHSPSDGAMPTAATCIDAECSRWTIPDSVRGLIKIEASHWGASIGPSCAYHALDWEYIDLDSASRHDVTLKMEFGIACI
jgi:hypothetical protein